MFRAVSDTIQDLKQIVTSLPPDSPDFAEDHELLSKAYQRLLVLEEVLEKEEHEAKQRMIKPGEKCTCHKCLVENFVEALNNLSYDELVAIVGEEVNTIGSKDPVCKLDGQEALQSGVSESKAE